ncbi:MAG: alpha-2-macroglobulin, partial [Gemmata sp.]
MADPLDPSPGQQTEPEDHRGTNWRAVGVILALLLSVPAGYQLFNWVAASRDAREKLAARDTAKAEYERLQAEHKIAQDAARQKLDAATAAEQEVGTKFGAEMAAARKILEEKNFTVRLTGPARVQPGAPNTWHIEAVDRGGRPAKPSKLEIAVKDATGAELYRDANNAPDGPTPLTLGAKFWEQVKPGADLFLEVVAFTDDNRTSTLAERIPLARPV